MDPQNKLPRKRSTVQRLTEQDTGSTHNTATRESLVLFQRRFLSSTGYVHFKLLVWTTEVPWLDSRQHKETVRFSKASKSVQ